jgi:ribosome-binding factor A
MSHYSRADRVGGLIQLTLSEIIVRETGDPRLEMVTISGVKMTRDLRLARVYFSISGGERRIASAAQALEQAKGYLKRALARKISLRYMPDLKFYHDESFDYGVHIENLLKSIDKNQQ